MCKFIVHANVHILHEQAAYPLIYTNDLSWQDLGYEYAKEFLPDYDQHDRDSEYFKDAENEFYHKGIVPALESFVYFVDDPNVMEDLDNITTFAFNKYGHALPKLMKDVRTMTVLSIYCENAEV